MYIRMPNNYVLFFDNGVSQFSERLAIVENLILGYKDGQWPKYFESGWLRESNYGGTTSNRTRDILDRIGQYLMLGNFKDANVLTPRMAKKTAQKEIPISNGPLGADNLLYAGMSWDEHSVTASPELIADDEPEINIYKMTAPDFDRQEKKAAKNKIKWRQTRNYRLNQLYSTPEIKTYRLKPVKRSDGKPLKDISYNVVLEAVEMTIGGHEGIIEPVTKAGNVPSYVAKWCEVDVDGNFEFMGKTYIVTDSRYAVENKAQIGSNADFTNKAQFEKILCIYTGNHSLVFYDEQIERVDADMTGETTS